MRGKSVRITDLRGKWVILDFWATWCEPCTASFPGLNAIAKQYAEKNVVALAVSVGDRPKTFDAWLRKHTQYDHIQFALDPGGIDGKGSNRSYQVGGLPTRFLIDPTGKISASFMGYDNHSDARFLEAMKVIDSPLVSPPTP